MWGISSQLLQQSTAATPYLGHGVAPLLVLEKTFESPLDCKEIQPVHPKGD